MDAKSKRLPVLFDVAQDTTMNWSYIEGYWKAWITHDGNDYPIDPGFELMCLTKSGIVTIIGMN